MTVKLIKMTLLSYRRPNIHNTWENYNLTEKERDKIKNLNRRKRLPFKFTITPVTEDIKNM